MKMDDINVRPAFPSDMGYIAKAVSSLNGKPIGPEDRERLKNDIFGDAPKAWAIVAETGPRGHKTNVGMALYSTTYYPTKGENMMLSHMHIDPEKIGSGKAMIEIKLQKILFEIAGKRGWKYMFHFPINMDEEQTSNTTKDVGYSMFPQMEMFYVGDKYKNQK